MASAPKPKNNEQTPVEPPVEPTPPAPPADEQTPPATPPAPSEESIEAPEGEGEGEGKDYLAEAYKLMGLNLDELVATSPRHSDARAYAARLQAADEALAQATTAQA